MNKTIIFLIVLFILSVPFSLATKPISTTLNEEPTANLNGCFVEHIDYFNVDPSQDLFLTFHIYNITTGTLLNSTTTQCNVQFFDGNGNHINNSVANLNYNSTYHSFEGILPASYIGASAQSFLVQCSINGDGGCGMSKNLDFIDVSIPDPDAGSTVVYSIVFLLDVLLNLALFAYLSYMGILAFIASRRKEEGVEYSINLESFVMLFVAWVVCFVLFGLGTSIVFNNPAQVMLLDIYGVSVFVFPVNSILLLIHGLIVVSKKLQTKEEKKT